jgi:RNA polymerase sigma-70 factor (ECF subfamily)
MDSRSADKDLTDEELVLRAQAGSRPCFEELVYRYTHRLYLYFRPKIVNHQDIEDLVQETFLKTYRNIGRYDQKYKFSTWIYTTAGRLAISLYRKKRENETAPEPVSPSEDPHEKMLREEDHDNIWNTAQLLHPDQYRALWLRYVEDMPVKDIAGVMKKSRIHVRVLIHRARSNLIKRLNPAAVSEGIEETAGVSENLSFL